MRVVYAPDGAARQVWEVDEADLTVGEIKLLEKSTSRTFQELSVELGKGSFTAMMSLVWIFRRRHEHDLTLNDLDDLRVSALSVETGDADEPEDAGDPKASTTPDESDDV